MLALLVFVSYPGWVCIPPVVLNSSVHSPYEGPFTMPIETAQRLKSEPSQLWLEIVRSDDPRFADLKKRCPPIFFPAR